MIRGILSSGWGSLKKLVTFALLLQGAGSWGELYLQGDVRKIGDLLFSGAPKGLSWTKVFDEHRA